MGGGGRVALLAPRGTFTSASPPVVSLWLLGPLRTHTRSSEFSKASSAPAGFSFILLALWSPISGFEAAQGRAPPERSAQGLELGPGARAAGPHPA